MASTPSPDLILEPLSLEGEGFPARPLSEWLTTFHLASVVLDPYTNESSWILKTAARVLHAFSGAAVRTNLVVTASADETRTFLGPLAKEFLRTGLTALPVQSAFGGAAGRMPAATAGTPATTLVKAFGVAGTTGIPVPNVPEMGGVWAPLGKAWATSTSGAAAVPAKDAFAEAELTIQASVG